MDYKINIYVDAVPEEDNNNRGQCEPTSCSLTISVDTENKIIYVTVDEDHTTNSMSMSAYNGHETGFSIGDNEDGLFRPKQDALIEYLNSEKAAGLIKTVADGYETEWDGNNIVGNWNDETGALEQLQEDIEDLPQQQYSIWLCEDWLSESHWVDSINHKTTDKELEIIAEEIHTDATEEGHPDFGIVIFADDLDEYLEGVRQDKIDEWELENDIDF